MPSGNTDTIQRRMKAMPTAPIAMPMNQATDARTIQNKRNGYR